ncbi:MmgE/PrpD family protein [Paraburkholderia susongensis]|uniref:MmgE/PrpD family protein n=1 Tax=Paraburkholderia susongensis TaxID=1515439 RepID=A0A1X7LBX2_9BURK|nr:MmgE/PrpD family protein [Paraburkholderia susongensis]SMG50994.1 MmgE/PrpD family protein [Paraburkholderia susongensis]
MHNPAAQSAVSDALTGFTAIPLTDQHVRSAAQRKLDEARKQIAEAGDTAQQLAVLLQAQDPTHDSTPNDTRTRAWLLGAILAKQTPASTATPILAAVIATGSKLAASDDEIAAAAAIGIEAAARLLAAVDNDEFRARWNGSSAVGILGAALALARLHRLDAARTRHALGIAATQAAGLARNEGQPMSAIETGKAAADAIEAVLLAKHGFTSAPASIDGRRGFAALMAYRFDEASIIEGLGTRWVSLPQ